MIMILTALIACIALLFFQTKDLEQASESGVRSDSNTYLEEVLESIEGVGKVKVYVHYFGQEAPNADSQWLGDYFRQQNPSQAISGLLIVAEGANDIFIRENLTETISRITQLPSHRIVIVPMKNEEDVEK